MKTVPTLQAPTLPAERSSSVELLISGGGEPVRRLRLTGTRWTIGAEPSCAIVLRGFRIRSLHAELTLVRDNLAVQGIEGEVHVNGRGTRQRCALAMHDRLEVGGYRFQVVRMELCTPEPTTSSGPLLHNRIAFSQQFRVGGYGGEIRPQPEVTDQASQPNEVQFVDNTIVSALDFDAPTQPSINPQPIANRQSPAQPSGPPARSSSARPVPAPPSQTQAGHDHQPVFPAASANAAANSLHAPYIPTAELQEVVQRATEQIQQRINELEAQVRTAAKHTAQIVVTDAERSRDESRKLEAERQRLQRSVTQLEQRISELESSIESSRKEVDSERETNRLAAVQIQQLEGTLSTLRDLHNTQQREVLNQSASLQSQLDKLTGELQRERESSRQSREELTEKTTTLCESFNTLSQELSATQQELEQARTELQRVQTELERTQGQLAQTQHQRDLAATEVESLRLRLQDSETRLASAPQVEQLDALQERLDSMQRQLVLLQNEQRLLTSQRNDLQDMVDKLRTELSDAETAFEQERQKWQSDREELNNQLTNAQSRAENVNLERFRLADQLEQARDKAEQAILERSHLADELAEARVRADNATAALASQTSEYRPARANPPAETEAFDPIASEAQESRLDALLSRTANLAKSLSDSHTREELRRATEQAQESPPATQQADEEDEEKLPDWWKATMARTPARTPDTDDSSAAAMSAGSMGMLGGERDYDDDSADAGVGASGADYGFHGATQAFSPSQFQDDVDAVADAELPNGRMSPSNWQQSASGDAEALESEPTYFSGSGSLAQFRDEPTDEPQVERPKPARQESAAEVLARLGQSLAEEAEEEAPPKPAPVSGQQRSSFNAYGNQSTAKKPEPEPTPSVEHEDDEASIEAYMNRLLARMQGKDEPAAPAPEPVRAEKPAITPSRPLTESGVFKAKPKTQPIDNNAEFTPRAPAPEKSTDIQAMRELAMSSARSAIAKSAKKKAIGATTTKIAICGVALATGVALLFWSKLSISAPTILAGICFAAAVVWGFDAYGTAKRNLRASNSSANPGAPAAAANADKAEAT